MAFFNTPGIERLYSGVTNTRAAFADLHYSTQRIAGASSFAQYGRSR